MTKSTYILILILFSFGCSRRDHLDETIQSPSGEYSVEVLIGCGSEYGIKNILMLRLLNKSGDELDFVNTRASDVMKWAVAWDGDETLLGIRHWALGNGQ